MIKTLLLCIFTLTALNLTACNTVQGAGKDIERGGEKMQGAAEGAQRS